MKAPAGGALFTQACRFVAAVTDPDGMPREELPEIAFAGRSNVGKSSLINALVGRRDLARTSRTPGRTQALMFYELGGRLAIVDMPGYGYAVADKRAKYRWKKLIAGYMANRGALRRVFLLIDARRGLGERDRAFMAMLDEAAVVYQGVLTKTDAAKKDRDATAQAVAAELALHPSAHPELLITSAREGLGLKELRAAAAAFARARPL